MIEALVGVLGSAVLLLGLALASIGLYGMLRKPALFDQLHAAGLVTGPGVILVLLAALASGSAEIATSAVLVIAFVLVTASLSTHAIALTAWRQGGVATRAPRDRAAERSASSGSGDASPVGALRVVLAHDGSPGADVATSLAASMSWATGSRIRVIGAVEGDLQPFDPTEDSAERVDAPDDLTGVLEVAVRALTRPGVTASAAVRRGDAATTIATEAEAFDADLVIIGTRGLGAVRTLLEGSVAAAVADAAPCPVLVARVPSIREVLLATDGSGPSELAIDLVARWPVFDGVPIRVLSIATGVAGGTFRGTDEAAGQLAVADAAVARLRQAGRSTTAQVGAGDPTDEILAFARSEPIDLIVLGSRGRTGVRRALLGSVARGVLSSADVSVLVIKEPKR
jgi:monovalent cation/proton antiporter MnhG/PhaG subunit